MTWNGQNDEVGATAIGPMARRAKRPQSDCLAHVCQRCSGGDAGEARSLWPSKVSEPVVDLAIAPTPSDLDLVPTLSVGTQPRRSASPPIQRTRSVRASCPRGARERGVYRRLRFPPPPFCLRRPNFSSPAIITISGMKVAMGRTRSVCWAITSAGFL